MNFKKLIPSLLYILCVICNSQTTVYTSEHFYLVKNNLKNYADANSYCASTYGTTLADIKTAALQTEMSTLIAGASITGSIWMYYNDIVTEGTFKWSDGTTGSYTNWATGEPNNSGGEDCASVYAIGNQWNDAPCTSTYHFACARPICWTGNYFSFCKTTSPSGISWSFSEDHCQSFYGTNLASILNPFHAMDARQLLETAGFPYGYPWGWIGLYKDSSSFVWKDTTPVSYTNWAPSNPSGDGNCGHIGDYVWNDISCTYPLLIGFFCNKPLPANHYYSSSRKYIYVKSTQRTYLEAKKYCYETFGTSLATIASSGDKTEITNMYSSYGYSNSWIGLYRSGSDWKWMDGTAYSYTAWATSEPSGDGICGEAYSDGTWNDKACHVLFYSICNAY